LLVATNESERVPSRVTVLSPRNDETCTAVKSNTGMVANSKNIRKHAAIVHSGILRLENSRMQKE